MHVGRSMSDEKQASNDTQGNAGGSTYHISLQMGDMEPRLANTVIALTASFEPDVQSTCGPLMRVICSCFTLRGSFGYRRTSRSS